MEITTHSAQIRAADNQGSCGAHINRRCSSYVADLYFWGEAVYAATLPGDTAIHILIAPSEEWKKDIEAEGFTIIGKLSELSTPRPAAPLVLRLAELARRKHYYCEDGWYSCPKNPDGCANDGMGPDCNCGADQINAEVDAILSELVPNTGREAR